MTRRLTDEAGTEHTIERRPDGVLAVDGQAVRIRRAGRGCFRVAAGGEEAVAWAAAAGEARWTFIDGQVFTFTVERRPGQRKRGTGHHGSLTAPMPATVVKVGVKPGDDVRAGEVVVVLEAMKMELPVRAPSGGRITAVNCREGELVQPGVTLVEIED